jgi:hypothetical protein
MTTLHALFASIMSLWVSFTGGHSALLAQIPTAKVESVIVATTTQQSVKQTPVANVDVVNIENATTATNTIQSTSTTTQPVKENEFKNQILSVSTARDILFSGHGIEDVTVKKVLIHGVINQGIFSGYTRVVVVAYADTWGDPGSDGTVNFIFVTKDFKTYILDKSLDYFMTDDNAHMSSSVVISTETIPFDFPKEITINSFILEQGKIDILSSTANAKKVLNTDLNLTYLVTSSQVFVEDNYGLRFKYSLLPKETYEAHQKTPNWDDKNYRNYYFNASEINTKQPLYNTYGTAFPGGCASGDDSLREYSQVQEKDLQVIGTTASGITMYAPVDKQGVNVQKEFDAKVSGITKSFGEKGFKELNGGISAPSIEQYTSKNPVLFFKDPWGRFVSIGEWDYRLEGGCGKPVIYLYPQKDTKVTVALDVPTFFTTQIPTYSNGWKVLAHPDGTLDDLQISKTDCSAIDSTKFGSEYAKSACGSGTYPYLYWSGNVQADYPPVQGGWIVSRDHVKSFLEEKLTSIGFNKKEKNDFLEYWVPEMLQKNFNVFRISFIATEQMNSFIPMTITPKPDSVYRLFMDWEPLSNFPSIIPKAQVLPSIQRDGFTVVEWGGVHPR